MSVLHAKSATLADFTGTVTAFDSAGNAVSVAATDLIRNTDWNSGHNQLYTLSGNTFSNSTASGSNVVFSAAGGASIGGSSDSLIFSAPLSVTTNGLISAVNLSAGTTSNNLSAFVFSNSNGLAFGLNGSTVTGSYTVPSTAGLISAVNLSAGATSNNLSAVTFSDSNGISFGLNGSVVTATVRTNYVTAQTNQSAIKGLGVSNVGNTAGNTGLSTGIDWVVAGSNGITASESTAAGGPNTIWLSGNTQTNQSAIKAFGATNTGNTAGNTGVSTGIDWVIAGTNGITISESTAGGGPNTLWVSGSTGGGAAATVGYWEMAPGSGTTAHPWNTSQMFMQPFCPQAAVSFCRMQVLDAAGAAFVGSTFSVSGSISGSLSRTAANTYASYYTAALFTRRAGANSTEIISSASTSVSRSNIFNLSVSGSTNGSSATASFSFTGQVYYVSTIDTAGNFTTASTSSTGSGTMSTTSNAGNTFSSSFSVSFFSQAYSNARPLIFPWATSISAGEYWMGVARTTALTTQTQNIQGPLSMAPGILMFNTNQNSYIEVGVTNTAVSTSGMREGQGTIATSVTSTNFPLQSVSFLSGGNMFFNVHSAARSQ